MTGIEATRRVPVRKKKKEKRVKQKEAGWSELWEVMGPEFGDRTLHFPFIEALIIRKRQSYTSSSKWSHYYLNNLIVPQTDLTMGNPPVFQLATL